MSEIVLRRADDSDAERLAAVIGAAFADVADRLGLTRENCPSHTAFLASDEVRRGMGFGNRYFMAFDGETLCGAVAIRLPRDGISILEKVAVLAAFRHRGIGRLLVEHGFAEARRMGATAVEIGIIASQTKLRGWYERFGFAALRQGHYPHLPFDVLHMRLPL
jgi:GNAT superfamily N-acetyltransferase